jgi:hypothetical protein
MTQVVKPMRVVVCLGRAAEREDCLGVCHDLHHPRNPKLHGPSPPIPPRLYLLPPPPAQEQRPRIVPLRAVAEQDEAPERDEKLCHINTPL